MRWSLRTPYLKRPSTWFRHCPKTSFGPLSSSTLKNKAMTGNSYPRDFETYWEKHKADLIRQAPCALKEERENNGKMNTAGDWLLFALPVIVIIGFTNTDFIKNELLRFIVALVIGMACFVVTVYIKPFVTGKRNIVDIDADIKAHFYNVYKEKGMKGNGPDKR